MNKNFICIFFVIYSIHSFGMESFNNLSQLEFDALALKHLEKMVVDYNLRKTAAQGSSRVLASGFWYAKDYLQLLTKHKQNKRIKWLREKDHFRNGFAEKGYLEFKNDEKSYDLKPTISAADAIANFGQYLIFIDCGNSIQVAYYKALLELLGEQKFNMFFSGIPGPLLAADITKTKIFYFLSQKHMDSLPHVGAHTYIANHPLYAMKHIYGDGNGFHVLASELPAGASVKFIGFGLPSEGLTADGIKNHLVDFFNEMPMDALFVLPETWEKEMNQRQYYARAKFDVLPSMKIVSIDDKNIWGAFLEGLKAAFPSLPSALTESYVENIKSQRENLVSSARDSFIVDINKVKARVKTLQ